MNNKDKRKPHTPSERFHTRAVMDVDANNPVRGLTESNHRKKGRNGHGRITSRRRGGGHKKLYRVIDFKRTKFDIPATITSIQYDPNRSANIALLVYADGEKAYILAPNTLKIGDQVLSTNNVVDEYNVGISLPLKFIPPSTLVHAVEMEPGRGAQLVRSAGGSAQVISIEGDRATLKMPSGEVRYFHSRCRATIGEVGNKMHNRRNLGKAGRNRWLGRRPRVRGVAMNPVDHPMGGGEGRTSGGGHPQSPWGQLSKGFPTRRKSKSSNSMILVRRNGRKVKSKKK